MNRLSKEQWLDHGLINLATSGFTSLKADTLAKSLGVSRGSFYWHFKDLASFHLAVLERWRDVAVNAVVQELESEETEASEKLQRLINIGVSSEGGLEQAIRAWAFSDAKVKEAVTSVDTQRLEYVQHLLKDAGLEPTVAAVRARIIYCGYLGQMMLGDTLTASQSSTLTTALMSVAIDGE